MCKNFLKTGLIIGALLAVSACVIGALCIKK